MTITLNALQKQRRDTASNWTSNNPTLLDGELGYETDTKKFKIGDGSTAWQSLDYLPIPDTNRLLAGNLTVGGNLTVSGTQTVIDTQTLQVEDKNIEIGKVSTPSDTTADGGGITLKAASDKTITWSNANDSWDFNQNINAASTYAYKINNVSVLNATTLGSSVVNSSLTSVGTIATGVWNATAISGSKVTPDFGSQAISTTNDSVTIGDSIIHSGDTDTKIRFPGADIVTVETAGSEHLRIAANGNITYSAASGETTMISKRTNAAGSNGNYFFHLNATDNNDNVIGSLGFHRDTAADDSRIVLSTRTSGGSNTERLRIDSSGKVGIGTTSPAALTHISKTYTAPTGGFDSNVCLAITNNASAGSYSGLALNSGASGGSYLHFGDTDDSNRGVILYDSDDAFKISTAASERMRIDSSGNVGIGTTSPSNSLDINSGNIKLGGGNGSALTWSSDVSSHYLKFTSALNGLTLNGYGGLAFETNGTNERMRIDSSGNVGIGTSDPSGESINGSQNLVIMDTTSDGGMNIKTGTSGNAQIHFSDTSANGQGRLIYAHANDSMQVYTSGTECARFISSGFLKARGNSASYHNASSGYHELIGDSSNDVVAKLKHNSSTGYGLQTLFNHASSSIYALSVRDYSSGYNDKAFIRCDGDLENANNSYGGISDIKLKENIVDAKSQWDDIKALKVRNFNYKSDVNKIKMLGLVAQEAETVCPSLVKSQPDLGENNEDLGTTTKVVKYSILYMKAIKALQEAIAKIEVLETKVAALEAA